MFPESHLEKILCGSSRTFQDGAQEIPIWRQDGTKVGQAGTKVSQDGVKVAQDGVKVYQDGADKQGFEARRAKLGSLLALTRTMTQQ